MQILIVSKLSDELKVGGGTPGPRNRSRGLQCSPIRKYNHEFALSIETRSAVPHVCFFGPMKNGKRVQSQRYGNKKACQLCSGAVHPLGSIAVMKPNEA
jgi:hypothetical protein